MEVKMSDIAFAEVTEQVLSLSYDQTILLMEWLFLILLWALFHKKYSKFSEFKNSCYNSTRFCFYEFNLFLSFLSKVAIVALLV